MTGHGNRAMYKTSYKEVYDKRIGCIVFKSTCYVVGF